MCAIIRYNQKRIMQNFENFIFHNLQIGVNWRVEWGTYWNVHTRKHSRWNKLDTINLQAKYGKECLFVNICLWWKRVENFGRCGNNLQNWKYVGNVWIFRT